MEYFVYQFQSFLLVLIRINSMFILAPFFSSDIIPFRAKVILSFFITLVIFPMVRSDKYMMTGDMGVYGLMVLREVAIGLFIGFLASIVFSAFQLAGQFFSAQVGFGMNEVLDPLAQVSIPVIGQLKNMVGILVFLGINGQHFMIQAVYKSFELAPTYNLSAGMQAGLLRYAVHSFSGMFVIALKLALPVIATIFLIEVSMGVLSKAAPQMNIMMLGFPIKIAAAFGLLAVIAPLVVRIMTVALERSFQFISQVLVHWPVN